MERESVTLRLDADEVKALIVTASIALHAMKRGAPNPGVSVPHLQAGRDKLATALGTPL